MKTLMTLIVIVAGLFSPICATAEAASYSVGLESRDTYTRWYEYPGIYYEEEWSHLGLRMDYFFDSSENNNPLKYGITASLSPAGEYFSWPATTASSSAIRVGALTEYSYGLQPQIDFIARGELAFLILLGSAGDANHSEDFGVYFPSMDLGLGLNFKGVKWAGADSVSVLYSFSVIDLGQWTDNWVSGTPVTEDWANSSISFMLNYKL